MGVHDHLPTIEISGSLDPSTNTLRVYIYSVYIYISIYIYNIHIQYTYATCVHTEYSMAVISVETSRMIGATVDL